MTKAPQSYPDMAELAERFQFFGEKAYRPEIFGADDRAPGPRVTQAECLAIAAALRGVAQAAPNRDQLIALIRSKARVAGHDAWEGGYYHLANAEEIADAILALSSTDPQCTCAAIVNPNIPHARSCPLYSPDICLLCNRPLGEHSMDTADICNGFIGGGK